MKNKQTYEAIVQCSNCGGIEGFDIPEGTSVKDYIKNKEIICINCRCESATLKLCSNYYCISQFI